MMCGERLSLLVLSLATLIFSGCAATKVKPVVWTDNEVSFADFAEFEIRPVFNASGTPIEQGFLDTLTAHLNDWFRVKQLRVTDDPETASGLLVVQNDLLVYETYKPVENLKSYGPAGSGETTCTLRTRLIDKARNKVVAEITTVKVAGAGGVYNVPFGPSTVNSQAHERVLKDVARLTAEAVAELMQPAVRD